MPGFPVIIIILESVQPSLTTLLEVPFPLSIPEGRASQLRTMTEREIGMLPKATPLMTVWHAGKLGKKPFQEAWGVPGLPWQRNPKAKPPHPPEFNIPRRLSTASHRFSRQSVSPDDTHCQ
jgi:hypothetical protein